MSLKIRILKKAPMNYRVSNPKRANPRTVALKYRIRQAIPESRGVADNLHRVTGRDLREFAGKIGRGVSSRMDNPRPRDGRHAHSGVTDIKRARDAWKAKQ